MKNGLYGVTFETRIGAGEGVVLLTDGKLRGGDSSMYYIGSYKLDGERFTAELKTDKHSSSPGMFSVLGKDQVTLNLAGTHTETSVTVSGTSPQAPGVTFQARLKYLCD